MTLSDVNLASLPGTVHTPTFGCVKDHAGDGSSFREPCHKVNIILGSITVFPPSCSMSGPLWFRCFRPMQTSVQVSLMACNQLTWPCQPCPPHRQRASRVHQIKRRNQLDPVLLAQAQVDLAVEITIRTRCRFPPVISGDNKCCTIARTLVSR
jgi:hypothetical protein